MEIVTFWANGNGIEYYQILTDYNEPDSIYLHTYQDIQGNITPGEIVFYYGDKGILAYYEFFGKKDNVRKIIVICPKPDLQKLLLGDEIKNLTEVQVCQKVAGASCITENFFRPIEEATNYSKHDFYLRYKDASQQGCFETPAGIW